MKTKCASSDWKEERLTKPMHTSELTALRNGASSGNIASKKRRGCEQGRAAQTDIEISRAQCLKNAKIDMWTYEQATFRMDSRRAFSWRYRDGSLKEPHWRFGSVRSKSSVFIKVLQLIKERRWNKNAFLHVFCSLLTKSSIFVCLKLKDPHLRA